MLTMQEGLYKAEKLAYSLFSSDLLIVKVEDRGSFWLFFYESVEYMNTPVLSHRMAGNHPVVVEKESGDTYLHNLV